jgi:23S rRNA (uracil1939-C5)-methyltransferase
VILTIDRLGHHGDGIAQGPEGPVFVPNTLPGEVVEGDLQGDRLTGLRILTPVGRTGPPALRPCPQLRRLPDAARLG